MPLPVEMIVQRREGDIGEQRGKESGKDGALLRRPPLRTLLAGGGRAALRICRGGCGLPAGVGSLPLRGAAGGRVRVPGACAPASPGPAGSARRRAGACFRTSEG